ncbi:hypothetical protein Nepgr_030193 [Nepenthes gracilis]|uniref:Protein kinase domain-containing protein n=1 Tax=Nepenthes gracilis TaxID=150966 RepID=A0AAD3Y5K6_NEPGR|nr:hypothetical protein Nepgr_030193 [Nepenthes gracilis]
MDSPPSDSSAGAIEGVVAVVIVVVVVIKIMLFCYCMDKAKTAISVVNEANQLKAQSTSNRGAAHLAFPVIGDSQLEAGTMERFLIDIAREKPIRFAPSHLAAFTLNFSEQLGSGGFGVVYKGRFPSGVHIAVKVLNRSSGKRMEEQFMAEIGTIGRTYHINLVKLFGFCFDPKMQALVYEYMENGSLDKLLFSDPSKTIEWEKLHEIAIGTAKGIAYLHEECQQRIIHYDIKPGNVLLDSNLNPKVADFGLAKLYNQNSTHVLVSGCRGTPGYAAPELWAPYPVTYKCDVYSFGMLLFEIVGRRRNHDANLIDCSREWLPRWTYEMLKKNELPEMIPSCGISEENREKAKRMVLVALWCVQYLPAQRPLMSTVVKMLEGAIEIALPPNPFGYLEDNNLNCAFNFGSEGNYDSSSSSIKPLIQSSDCEIEIAC